MKKKRHRTKRTPRKTMTVKQANRILSIMEKEDKKIVWNSPTEWPYSVSEDDFFEALRTLVVS